MSNAVDISKGFMNRETDTGLAFTTTMYLLWTLT